MRPLTKRLSHTTFLGLASLMTVLLAAQSEPNFAGGESTRVRQRRGGLRVVYAQIGPRPVSVQGRREGKTR